MNNDLPAVVGHDSPTLRQTESETAASLATAIKRIKHVAPYLSRDPGPVVTNDNLNPRPAGDIAPPDRDGNTPPVVDRLDRIPYDGIERHAELSRITADFWRKLAT